MSKGTNRTAIRSGSEPTTSTPGRSCPDPPAQINARGHAQLRLEAIDTLETHFQSQHQPLGLATRALDFLLHQLGISGAVFDPLKLNTVEAEDGAPGYIIAREVERNGRAVAFAFAGART